VSGIAKRKAIGFRSRGKPDILYALPQQLGFTDQGIQVDNNSLTIAAEAMGIIHCPVSKNEDLYQLLECYCKIQNIAKPLDAFTGLDVYVRLLAYLESDDFEI